MERGERIGSAPVASPKVIEEHSWASACSGVLTNRRCDDAATVPVSGWAVFWVSGQPGQFDVRYGVELVLGLA